MTRTTTHRENIAALRRIEGQIKGLQRMIEGEKYCIDIIIQINAAINALYRVGEKIFVKHIDHCVKSAFQGRSEKAKTEKIDEIMKVVKQLNKLR
ncbi:MAG: metal-sensitive transcriptional regulator [Candidatus Omnitrophica bacterium]|nr:metal-sensitive transcriptional regulator [Candidatus Omnitrophota bacterium]